jgi:hypothetical protein
MNSRSDPHGSQVIFDDGDLLFSVVDMLFNVPLYAWWVVVIEQFPEGEIQGTLLTCPIDVLGPYETQLDATNYVRSQLNNSPMNGQQG